MPTVSEQTEFLQDFLLLVQYAIRLGFKVTSGELYRPQAMQEIYYDTGRSKTLNSRHTVKMAGDLNFFLGGRYINSLDAGESERIIRPLGVFWESLSAKNRWGGNWDKDLKRPDPWRDIGHFERTD